MKYPKRRYELEVYEENTVDDLIEALIESGLINAQPKQGYR